MLIQKGLQKCDPFFIWIKEFSINLKNDEKMYYEINVAKREFVNNEPSYHHLFATHQRSLQTHNELKRCLEIIVKKFPYPDYQIDVKRNDEIFYGEDIDEILGRKVNRLMKMFDLTIVQNDIKECNPGEVVILCGNWSINKPKYTEEEIQNGVDEADWDELEKVLGFVLEVNDYDDLIVDPFGCMD